jgi:hypothetical protein
MAESERDCNREGSPDKVEVTGTVNGRLRAPEAVPCFAIGESGKGAAQVNPRCGE